MFVSDSSPRIRESEMYPAVKAFLSHRGFVVRGEVKDCDVVAVQGETVLVVEMKRQFSTQVLVQAVERQQISEWVYIAIPKPKLRGQAAKWRGVRTLLRRLELGLLFVDVKTGKVSVELDPDLTPKPKPRPKVQKRLLTEFHGRTGDYNIGGSTRRKLVTHYREQALHIATCLLRESPQTPAALRKQGTSPRTTSILYRNVYGWFERVRRGQYQLTAPGRQALTTFREVVEQYE
jgi:hypothetical protein